MSNWPYLIGVDVETTGLIATRDAIIELGASIMDPQGNYIDDFSEFCNPGKPIPPKATEINNITNEMVENAPSPEDVLRSMFDWIKEHTDDNAVLFFHNAPFDARFLVQTGIRGKIAYKNFLSVDTLPWTRKIPFYKKCDNYKLEHLVEHIGYEPSESHRACEDAKSALELMKHNIRLLKKSENLDKLYKMYNLFSEIGQPLSYYGETKSEKSPKKYKRYSTSKSRR